MDTLTSPFAERDNARNPGHLPLTVATRPPAPARRIAAIDRSQPPFRSGPSRRAVLAAAGALATVSLVPLPLRAAPRGGGETVVLHARPGRARLLGPDRPETAVWGYGGRVPGPPIVVARGGEVHARLVNGLARPTTVHWHGVRIDNAMDGVPGLTQAPVLPGESFDYRFRVPDAGSFWYHPPGSAPEQIGRGLYGPLIVQEDEPPAVDQDLLVLLDDWRLGGDGQIDDTFGDLHDAAQAGRLGDTLTVNGTAALDVRTRAGERVRLRLFNVADARVMGLRFTDHAPLVVALDGQPVVPRPAPDATVTLAPGQRADVIVDMVHLPGTAAPLVAVLGEREVGVGRIVYHAYDLARETPLAAVAPLPVNLPAEPLLTGARRIEIAIAGGALGRFPAGSTHAGRRLDPAGLIAHGQAWTLNASAGLPDRPLFSVRRGTPVIVLLRNGTRWAHAMHLHGHHVRVPGAAGPAGAAWRDTVLVAPGADMEVAFLADNPGKWLIHCQIAGHHAAGMATWFVVGDGR